jgi:putative aminopeptidase FrvX
MNRNELLKLAKQVLSLPTAPYHEHAVREFVLKYCSNVGLRVESDRVGNVIATFQRGSAGTSRSKLPLLVFAAHMDHPGFEALGPTRAEFLGGVPKELFKNGRVRFFSGGRVVRARVKRLDARVWPKRKLIELETDGELRKGDFGMWDLPAFRVANGRLHAAAIDDVLSVVVVLATLAEVTRRKLSTHIWGVFTRAEEVGFHGAVELARSRRIPRDALVVSMEMSRERPWAQIGDGPVVRVGDRMTAFDPLATLFLQQVALQSAIQVQRCLMDGGSCEATAYAAFGYRVGGLCLPLGNYHNIGANGKARPEYVSVNDLEGLLRLTVTAAEQWKDFGKVAGRLRARVEEIRKRAPRKLTTR